MSIMDSIFNKNDGYNGLDSNCQLKSQNDKKLHIFHHKVSNVITLLNGIIYFMQKKMDGDK